MSQQERQTPVGSCDRNSDGSESWASRRAALSAILESSLDVLAAGRISRDGRKQFGEEGVGKGEARF